MGLAERLVLDSYALLAFLEGSRGCGLVREVLEMAGEGDCRVLMSIVNLGEVLYITERGRGLHKAHEVLARVEELPIEILDADKRQTLVAAHLKASFPIAFADCFCAALAVVQEAAIVTGDPEFRLLEEASIVSLHWPEDD